MLLIKNSTALKLSLVLQVGLVGFGYLPKDLTSIRQMLIWSIAVATGICLIYLLYLITEHGRSPVLLCRVAAGYFLLLTLNWLNTPAILLSLVYFFICLIFSFVRKG